MIVLSLVLNILVLVAVGGSLIAKATWTRSAYGDRTPARDILLAIYLAILIGSAALLLFQLTSPAPWMLGALFTLLGVQIVYKVLTAVTVQRALHHPVVISNLAIAAVHSVTLATLIPMFH